MKFFNFALLNIIIFLVGAAIIGTAPGDNYSVWNGDAYNLTNLTYGDDLQYFGVDNALQMYQDLGYNTTNRRTILGQTEEVGINENAVKSQSLLNWFKDSIFGPLDLMTDYQMGVAQIGKLLYMSMNGGYFLQEGVYNAVCGDEGGRCGEPIKFIFKFGGGILQFIIIFMYVRILFPKRLG